MISGESPVFPSTLEQRMLYDGDGGGEVAMVMVMVTVTVPAKGGST
jgi:hypothetical protein